VSDTFPVKNGLKQGDILSPLLFSFYSVNIIRKVQVDQSGLKVNITHHLPVYTDDVTILSGSVLTMKESREALVIANK
jgi:hypothetical protein